MHFSSGTPPHTHIPGRSRQRGPPGGSCFERLAGGPGACWPSSSLSPCAGPGLRGAQPAGAGRRPCIGCPRPGPSGSGSACPPALGFTSFQHVLRQQRTLNCCSFVFQRASEMLQLDVIFKHNFTTVCWVVFFKKALMKEHIAKYQKNNNNK